MLNPALAKLLAKENIDITYGNYETAFFNVEKRQLGMPIRADQDKDIESLFCLHEIGHALHTPAEGWHYSVVEMDIPRDILNIVEDARIEKLVIREYPGSITSFKRGYSKLVEKQFFGEISEEIVANFNLLDRLNIKCKLRDLIKVEFSAEELTFYQRALTLETWEDVLMLSQDLVDFIDNNTIDAPIPPQPSMIDEQEEGNEEYSDKHLDELLEDYLDQMLGEDPDMEKMEDLRKEIDSRDWRDEPARDEQEVSSEEQENTEFVSQTDRTFKEREREMNRESHTDEDGREIINTSGIRKLAALSLVNKYEDLRRLRPSAEDLKNIPMYKYNTDLHEDAFYDYMKKVGKNVSYAVKEFELRKNAFQQTRALTRDSGSLDVNKVHSYKYNDNIFAQFTQLGEFKNHGIVMLLDWSGSMCGVIDSVLDQLIHLVVFCKKINVPFEVYSFTSGDPINPLSDTSFSKIDFNSLQFNELVSSSMSKRTFEEACYSMFLFRDRARQVFYSQHDYMGSTPLKEALLVSDHIIGNFKARTGVDKVNFVCLTDGDANTFNIDGLWGINSVNIMQDGKILKFSQNHYRSSGQNDVAKILDYISDKHNTNNIGFFVAGSKRDAHYRVGQAHFPSDYGQLFDYIEENKSDFNKELRKNNCIELNDVLGYNSYFVTVDRQLSIDDDVEFQVDSSEKRDVMRSFKQHQSSRKANKVLMGKIGKAFA